MAPPALLSGYPTPEEMTVMLAPKQTISVRGDIFGYWSFGTKPGEYAMTAPVVCEDYEAAARFLKPHIVSNTCYFRVLPSRKAPAEEAEEQVAERTVQAPKGVVGIGDANLSMRFSAGGRTARSQQAPLPLGDDTYLPADAVAQLLGGGFRIEAGKLIIEQGKRRLVVGLKDQVAILPSGGKKSGVLVPLGQAGQAMVSVAVLGESFAIFKQVTWRVAASAK